MAAEILIVEDEVLIAMALQSKLENFGFNVTGIAASGGEALAKVVEHPPDLILMDIVIQGEMDGVQTAQKIWEQYRIPVIYLTAYDDEKNLNRAKRTQPSAYLLKPYNDRELEITIELALNKERTRKRVDNQQRWYSTILRCLGEVVITVDAEMMILYMNPAAEAMFNKQSSELLGRPLEECCHFSAGEKTVAVDPLVREVMESGERIQKTGLRSDEAGSRTEFDLSIAPIWDEEDILRGSVLVFHESSARAGQARSSEQNQPSAEADLLSYREKQVLQHMVDGQATKQLANTLGISPRTVEFHRYNLMRKLHVEDIPSLVRKALVLKLVDL